MTSPFNLPCLTATARRWAGRAAATLFAAAVLLACGGGVGVGGTGSFASGPISGFASVIVNGVEFDDSAARVEDEDGALSASSALRLGMTTEIDSGPIGGPSSAPTAAASRIRFASELAAPATRIDLAARTLVLAGQTVALNAATVFDDRLAAGLASVAVGDVVRVYGSFDVAANGFVATRIEPVPGGLALLRVRAPVRNLDTAARTFTLGPATFSYAGVSAAALPALLANGVFVRVHVSPQPSGGRWAVIDFGASARALPDAEAAHLRGAITSIASITQFSVGGRAVDAAGASFPDGSAGIALGAQVDVQGVSAGGVLSATQVRLDRSGVSPEEVRLSEIGRAHV